MENSNKKPPVYSIPAQIEKVATRKGDKSLVITIGTNEISSIQKAVIMDMQDKHVYFFICEAELSADGVIEAMPEPKRQGEKWSSSQKLRFALRGYHKAKGGRDEEFEDWYYTMMQDIIANYNKKANDLNNQR